MPKSCVYVPNVGERTFFELKKAYGYDTAWEILTRGLNPDFIEDHKDTLKLDADGVPSAESLMKTEFMQNLVGSRKIIDSEQQKFQPVVDTAENYTSLLEQAKNFNESSQFNNKVTAVVDRNPEDDSQLQVRLVQKSDAAERMFLDQYSAAQLANRLVRMFAPLGITLGTLSSVEQSAGRVGVIRFDTIKRIGEDAVNVISVADNMEGVKAVSEEFSHLIIRALADQPLVQRSLAVLSADDSTLRQVLGDEYEDTISYHNGNMALVAEEALGQILQRNLIKQEAEREPAARIPLIDRLINFIRNLFSRFSAKDVRDAINEADQYMSELSKKVLRGEVQITQQRIASIASEDSFNSLSERIERNIKILKDARLTESKRPYITRDVDEGKLRGILNGLGLYIDMDDNPAKTVEGLLMYAREALKALRNLDTQFGALPHLSPDEQMTFLREVRQYIQSYGEFIEALAQLRQDEAALGQEDLDEFENMADKTVSIDGKPMSISSVIPELRDMTATLNDRFAHEAMPKYAAYLQQFVKTSDGLIPMANGERISVLKLLQEAPSDISMFDRWLDGANESADPIVRLTDAAVKEAKNKVQRRTMEFVRRIQQLMLEAEKRGIKNFEWAYEKDANGKKTGTYISPVAVSSFKAAYDSEVARLNFLYGKNPQDPTQRSAKLRELNDWERANGVFVDGQLVPNPDKWPSTAYDKLSADQKYILDKYLELKSELDAFYPSTSTYTVKAVQMRKSSYQRLADSLSSPKTFLDNIKRGIVESVFLTTSDEGEFGVSNDTIDFAGKHHMVLPVMFTRDLENPDELSTDLFGTLMAYAYSAINYDELDKIVDTLEVGRTLVNDYRKVTETLGKKKIRERINRYSDRNDRRFVHLSDTANSAQQLNDYLDSKVYSRYLKDSGAFDVFGKQTNANKLASILLKYSSIAQLGFNWLANTANVLTGVAMQNIEAACGEFFKASELARADAEYLKLMKDFLPEVGARVKKSKLALFDELINFKGNFRSDIATSQKRNIIERMFGSGVLFFGQDAGDHWLYNRTAIAMTLRMKVKVPGNSNYISLWEALKTRNTFEGNNSIQEMYLPEGTVDEKGNAVDMQQFGREVLRVNQTLFGVYNEDDSSAANRVAAGRLILQYKKWMKPQFNKRFQKKQYDVTLDREIEGYYRTLYRVSKELFRSHFQWQAMKDSLTETDKKNLLRCFTEMAQLFGVWALANLVDWPDDKDRPWAMKMAEYSAQRLTHELGNLAPTPMMLTELSKTFESPIASASAVKNLAIFVNSLVDPRDWNDELQSGTFKGHSTLYKNFMKAPFPGVAQYRMLDRFMNGLDTGIAYYVRSY